MVAVQVDTDAGLDRLGVLLAPWVVTAVDEAWAGFRPAFGVRLESTDDRREAPTSGPRPVPQLRHGSTVIARSRQPDDIVRALAQVLGGVHQRRGTGDQGWTNRRPFVRNESVVLVDVRPPTLVNDPQLARAGIEELAAWSVVVGDDGSVTVPPPLPGLDWDSIGIEAPSDTAWRFRMAGEVGPNDARWRRAPRSRRCSTPPATPEPSRPISAGVTRTPRAVRVRATSGCGRACWRERARPARPGTRLGPAGRAPPARCDPRRPSPRPRPPGSRRRPCTCTGSGSKAAAHCRNGCP